MAGPFEVATCAAIEEMIQTHAQPSKFGYILTHANVQGLVRDLYDLLVTSRSLKAAGDRFLGQESQQPPQRPSPHGAPPSVSRARPLNRGLK